MKKPTAVIAAVIAAAIALAGCGANHLSTDDQVRVAYANMHLATFCVDKISGGDIPQSEFADAANGMDTLTAVFQAHPDYVYDKNQTMRQMIATESNDLAGCDNADSDALRTLLLGQ